MPQPAPLPRVFAALSDPTRLAIVERLLAEGERHVGELAKPFAMSLPPVSKHLRVLESAGLIAQRSDRQRRLYRALPEAIRTIEEWLDRHRRFWAGALDRPGRRLSESEEKAAG